MKRGLACLLLLVASGFSTASAQTVLTFDDIPCGGGTPVGLYNGVDFNGQFTCYDYAQDPYNPHSGAARVYDVTSPATFNFLSPTNFDGAWFAGQASTSVQFQLFYLGALVGSSSTLFTSATPTFLASGYGGSVDAVSIVSNAPDYYIMDDVTFGSRVVATPEPASLALLGTGLIGVFGIAKRRNSNR